ncbi:MAG TPA: hypothetical protein VGG06_05225 [Thermoanaerobaculia bacterium]
MDEAEDSAGRVPQALGEGDDLGRDGVFRDHAARLRLRRHG